MFDNHGRIVDTANQDISHSEGQGYGMLLAAAAGDKTRFDKLWKWTKSTLQRHDKLFSWRYTPCKFHDARCVSGTNNATDGDELIAWALLRGAERWHNPAYKQEALTIISAIKQKLVIQAYGYTILIPAENGFPHKDGGIQLNLSYWIFPALQAFYKTTGDPIWQHLITSGTQLIAKARFGHWKLPPDWVRLTANGLTLKDTLTQEYGYNAVRIPLYLIWQDSFDPKLITPFLKFWDQSKVPATINLITNQAADYSYSTGMKAIAAVSNNRLGVQPRHTLPCLKPDMDYFSASLTLLSLLASLDTQR